MCSPRERQSSKDDPLRRPPTRNYENWSTLPVRVRSAGQVNAAESIESILGADYETKTQACRDQIKHTWTGTISYTWDQHGTCTGTCKLDLSEGSGVLHVRLIEESPNNQHWLDDGSDYTATEHYRSETADANCTTKVEDDTWSASGPMSEGDAFYLSEYTNNTYAYLGFSAEKNVDVHVHSTNSDCSTNDFVLPNIWHQFRAAGGDCPQLPRSDGDPFSGLRASKTTQAGQLVLDFTCQDSVTTSYDTTNIHVTGSLTENRRTVGE